MAERHVKVDPSTYKENYTSNRGFYYDSQLEDPFLSISLHPNTIKGDKENEAFTKTDTFTKIDGWKIFKDENCLTPTTGGDYDHYSKTPIARCIMTEDFIYSISNNWTGYDGGNAIESMFDSFKPYAPLASMAAKGIEQGIASMGGSHLGSGIVKTVAGAAIWVKDKLKNMSSALNSNLIVQGTKFNYYSGTGFNFNNMELKFIVFSDWVNGEFQSVEKYIEKIQPYVIGKYHPSAVDLFKEVDDFISNYVGYQSPPGGFMMDTKQIQKEGMNTVLRGTLRLNIGGMYAINNLIIKNMTVNVSKSQAKDPTVDGGVVPLYAEIALQLEPACMILDGAYSKIINHKGVDTDIIDPMRKAYAEELLKKKKYQTELDKKILAEIEKRKIVFTPPSMEDLDKEIEKSKIEFTPPPLEEL